VGRSDRSALHGTSVRPPARRRPRRAGRCLGALVTAHGVGAQVRGSGRHRGERIRGRRAPCPLRAIAVRTRRTVPDDGRMTAVAVTSLPAGYRTVDLPAERAADVIALDAWAFPSPTDDETALGWPSPLTWSRVRGVEAADGELVAMHASYPFARFPVPGGHVPAAGLTWVGVHPGHRRRGLLRAMIGDHVRRSLDRGEPVSALFAAELSIYGRFGYGLAARELQMTIPRGAALRDVPGGAGRNSV